MDTVQALPRGTRLLHIGPFKTGTTTVQAAFHQNRESLARQGIHYAGPNAQPMTAAMAAASDTVLATARPGNGRQRWIELVQEVHSATTPYTVISSEFFSEADDDHVKAIVDALDRERTHVVVTLRPLVRILGSQWQQYMQNRIVEPYDQWLHEQLDVPGTTCVTPSFWRRHRHDQLVERWSRIVGSNRLTVVVVDERDKQMVLRTFEQMLSLEPQSLVPHDLGSNRSLTWAEAELMRSFNLAWRAEGLSTADYTKFVRFGAARHLQQRRPGPDEVKVPIPAWAVVRATEVGAEMANNIKATGVAVVGDLRSLSDPELAQNVADVPSEARIPAAAAARLLSGLVRHLVAVPGRPVPASRVAGSIEIEMRRRRRRSLHGEGPQPLRRQVRALRAQLETIRLVDEMSRLALLTLVARRALKRFGVGGSRMTSKA